MNLTTVYDCIGSELDHLTIPPGVLMAGYVTGSGDVPWTEAQFARHPDAIRIDQWPTQTPAGDTADLIDVENGAVPISGVVGRVEVLRNTYRDRTRPGQRWPAVYVEESELTPVANALDAAGITSGVNLFLTKPMPQQAAIKMLDATGGPFPLVGIQYEFNDGYDVSVVSTGWLNNVSGAAPTPASKPGVQDGWRFCSKCTSLFYGGDEARSFCPRGGTHDGSQSHSYTLNFSA